MFKSVRSVRAMIGRIPTAAASSINALTGKQKRCSVPSAFRICAMALDAFMKIAGSFGCQIMIEHLKTRGLVSNHPPQHQAGRSARLDDAPLAADADDASRQVLFTERLAGG